MAADKSFCEWTTCSRERELANIEQELETERDKAMLGWCSPQVAWGDHNIEKEVVTPIRPLRPHEPKDPSLPRFVKTGAVLFGPPSTWD